jgi:hypothetical protein
VANCPNEKHIFAIVPFAPVDHEPVLPGFDLVVRAVGVWFEKVIRFVEGLA